MVLVVIYGIYNLFLTAPSKTGKVNQEKNSQDIHTFVTDIAKRLKDDSAVKQAYILTQARNEWGKDPFLSLKPQAQADIPAPIVEALKIPEEKFSYTGYLKMGDRKLAIINGAEYELGDELGRGGPVIKSIDPKQVIIAVPGTADEIILPLKETR